MGKVRKPFEPLVGTGVIPRGNSAVVPVVGVVAANFAIAQDLTEYNRLVIEHGQAVELIATLRDAAADWRDDTEEDSDHIPEWQNLSKCIAKVDTFLATLKTKED